MLSSLLQLGLRNSAVRDVAATTDQSRVKIIVEVVRRWSWLLGIFAAVVTLALSPQLSQWTFGDSNHTCGFMALAIVMMLSAISNGELAIMQGLKQLKRLAKASLWGVVGGLAVSVPLFYYWGIDSIVPALIAYAVITTIAVYVNRSRPEKLPCTLSLKETFTMGRGFIVLGIYMTISAFAAMLASYIFMVYLNHEVFKMIENRISVDLLARLLSTQLTTRSERHLLDQNRTYYKLLRSIILEGQERNELTNSLSANEIVKAYAIFERAVMYDWCICGGDYSLCRYCEGMMPRFLDGFCQKE